MLKITDTNFNNNMFKYQILNDDSLVVKWPFAYLSPETWNMKEIMLPSIMRMDLRIVNKHIKHSR